MPKILIGSIFILWSLLLPRPAKAIPIASQTEGYNSSLNVWQSIQELGSNLAGTVSTFTFRVSTAKSHLNQFDFTAENSRIYDKSNNNSFIAGCVPTGSNITDKLRGLTFNTTNVPTGYEDVTIDFSCRNYDFIPGHKYLIRITNANMGNSGSGLILFTAYSYTGTSLDYFTEGGLRYANGNRFDSSNNSGSCNVVAYTWGGTNPFHNGCFVFTTPKDDLYFVLNNNAPPPKLPVIFIPGIGGSELKATQDIIWSSPDGHNGTYSHGYSVNEKIWVNQDEAVKLGDDDYFDVLRLKSDGVTPEAALSLTGNMSPYGYGDIDSFFTGMGYVKGTNFFEFNYDWRKDVRSTKDDLDALIETAKTASGQPKVNLVVHSMGGLIARFYISDPNKAIKVNKLIELGVPHLGATNAVRTLMYGFAIQKNVFGIFPIGIPSSEIKDTSQNMTSIFQLLPSNKYFDFYDYYPFRDDRDIDTNAITGMLNYDQTKNLLSNLDYNMTVFNTSEQFHSSIDPILNQTNGTKVYEIVGTAQPTLGQIHETWWITWPVNLIPKTDEIYINGDDTVPLYSASLKNDTLDISGATKIYYVEQKHADLVSQNGTAMATVKSLLNDDNALPVEVKDQKITLEGEQISLDDGELGLYDEENRHCGLNSNGEVEENIPDVTCTTSGNTKHAFVKKKAAKVKVTVTRKKPATVAKTTSIKKRTYKQDLITKTTLYKDIAIPATGKIEFILDPAIDVSPSLTFYPEATKTENITITLTSEVSGNIVLDQTTPTTKIDIAGTKDSSGIYTDPVTITLTGSDNGSGILTIEYSLDNGVSVATYSDPFIISSSGKTTIQVKSIDKVGNEENPQTMIIEIAALPTPTPTPTPSSTSTSSISSSSTGSSSNTSDGSRATSEDSSEVDQTQSSISSPPAVLGIIFENPSHISDQINISKILDNNLTMKQSDNFNNISSTQILGGLLIISGGIISLATIGLITTFLKPFPTKM